MLIRTHSKKKKEHTLDTRITRIRKEKKDTIINRKVEKERGLQRKNSEIEFLNLLATYFEKFGVKT